MNARSRGVVALAGAVAGLSLLAAGCGGGGSPPSAVANLGTTTGATETTQSPATGSVTSKGGKQDAMRSYAVCMRKNGVPNFPDPGKDGGIAISSKDGLNPGSPQFRKADTTCKKLLPNGGEATPAERAKMQSQMLRYSACMRSHGVPNFPDPQFSNNGARLTIGPRSGIRPNGPQFQAAQRACQSIVPGLKTGQARAEGGSSPGGGSKTGGAVAP
jgi:hypothetical protein